MVKGEVKKVGWREVESKVVYLEAAAGKSKAAKAAVS